MGTLGAPGILACIMKLLNFAWIIESGSEAKQGLKYTNEKVIYAHFSFLMLHN